jgi:hypothetical protein
LIVGTARAAADVTRELERQYAGPRERDACSKGADILDVMPP